MNFFTAWRVFLKGVLLNPRSMGSVIPSSKHLANCMARCIENPEQVGFVLELGPGTGVVTESILATGVPPTALIVLELATHFAQQLQQRFPEVEVIQGNAKDLVALTTGKSVHTIISSLPLRSLPKEDREKILAAIAQVLQPNGRFIQFTYSLHDKHRFTPNAMQRIQSFIVWRNFPPARVDVFVRN